MPVTERAGGFCGQRPGATEDRISQAFQRWLLAAGVGRRGRWRRHKQLVADPCTCAELRTTASSLEEASSRLTSGSQTKANAFEVGSG